MAKLCERKNTFCCRQLNAYKVKKPFDKAISEQYILYKNVEYKFYIITPI